MIEGGYYASNNNCSSMEGYVHVCNGNYGQTTWNGKSQWSYSIEEGSHDGHILNCVIRLNDHEWVYGEEGKLLCHELGHCLVRIRVLVCGSNTNATILSCRHSHNLFTLQMIGPGSSQ